MSEDVDEIRNVVRGVKRSADQRIGDKTPSCVRSSDRSPGTGGSELGLGVLWVVIALVVLKFNDASVVTVGILTGIMFLVFAAEEFALAALDTSARWIWALFGVLLTAAGIVSLIHPRNTFAGFADILGFVFLVIGVLWLVQAFHGAGGQQPLVARTDQRHPDGHPGLLGERRVLS